MQWSALSLTSELRPHWLRDEPVRLPGIWQEAPRIERRGQSIRCNFDLEQTIRLLQEETWAQPMRTPAARVPSSYVRLPGYLRLLAAKLFFLPQRLRRRHYDPPWPIASNLDVLLELSGARRPALWGDAAWGAALTVDVDTRTGLRHAPDLADAIEAAGFRCCFYIVGDALQREPAVVRELHERGHEIGSHDVLHDNRICSLPPRERDERLRTARALLEPYAGVGFRSPSALRTPELIAAVGNYFDYDSSVCDTDLEHVRGCTTVFPYALRGCLEIPFTLPMDASLAYTGYSASAGLAIWKSKCAYIRAIGGMAMLLVHAEPHFARGARRDALRHFLDWLREQSDLTVLLPADIARRWRRDAERRRLAAGGAP